VVKKVVNDGGGTKAPNDFMLDVTTGQTPTARSMPGSDIGTELVVEAGPYSVTEASYDGYAMTTSTDCMGTIAAGDMKTCTVTNTYVPPVLPTTGTLIVKKHVENDDGGTLTAGDFTLDVASGPHMFPQGITGNESGTAVILEAGAYSVTETPVSGYNVSTSTDCVGTLAVGETKTCTVTNNDIDDGNGDDEGGGQLPSNATTGTLIVVKQVINDNGGVKTAENFTMIVTEAGKEPVRFAGSEAGVTMVIGTGAYTARELGGVEGYFVTYGPGCAGTMTGGAEITCTIVNDDGSTGGGGGGGVYGGGSSGGQSSGGGSPPVINTPAPTPRVLGEEDVNGTAGVCTLTESEALFVTPSVADILGHLGIARDTAMEDYYNRVLAPRVLGTGATDAQIASIRNFINYGTKTNRRLGQGERAGAVDSFHATYGRLPSTDCDWQNVIKIAKTRLPQESNVSRET
jgi:hypothetical protein